MTRFPVSIVRTLGLVGVLSTGAFGLASGCTSAGGDAPNDAPGTGGAGGGAAGAGAGDEKGPCYPNKTCNGTLSCLSDICVNAGGVGGTGGKGGKGGAAGTNSAGSGAGGGTAGGSSGSGGSGQSGSGAASGATGKGGASAGAGTGGTTAGTSGTAGTSAGTGATGGSSAGTGASAGAAGSGAACAGDVYTAQQDPAALLFVLDRSASMHDAGKWQALASAVVQAMDQPEFDSMSVGLLAAPSGSTPSPSCISDLLPTVPCLAPASPQIALAPVGSKPSSDPAGLRGQVKSWVNGNAPSGPSLFDPDASPLFAAIQNGLGALAAWPESGKRILVVVTDGSIDCNQDSNRPGFPDGNGCSKEWEDPNNIVDMLVKPANADPTKPVQTFVVGVPGADTYDPSGFNYPPYHMRLALSAIGYAGAPLFVDPACTGTAFTPGGGDPTIPCHFDMTQGSFDAQALADNLAKIRSKTLGCTFNLPTPAMGTIDPALVNVQADLGMGLVDIPRRKDPNDMCLADPCWDYDANGKVEVIGQECDAIKNTPKPIVVILAGCTTNFKP